MNQSYCWINCYNNHSAQQNVYIQQVKSATSKDAVVTIVGQAQDADAKAQYPQELQKAKEVAIKEVNALNFLSKEQKMYYVSNIESAKTIDRVNLMVQKL